MSISAKAIGCVFLRSLTMPAFFVIRHFSPHPPSHSLRLLLWQFASDTKGGGFQGVLLRLANMTSCSSTCASPGKTTRCANLATGTPNPMPSPDKSADPRMSTGPFWILLVGYGPLPLGARSDIHKPSDSAVCAKGRSFSTLKPRDKVLWFRAGSNQLDDLALTRSRG
jgi:hypothetical protein